MIKAKTRSTDRALSKLNLTNRTFFLKVKRRYRLIFQFDTSNRECGGNGLVNTIDLKIGFT